MDPTTTEVIEDLRALGRLFRQGVTPKFDYQAVFRAADEVTRLTRELAELKDSNETVRLLQVGWRSRILNEKAALVCELAEVRYDLEAGRAYAENDKTEIRNLEESVSLGLAREAELKRKLSGYVGYLPEARTDEKPDGE